MIIVGSRWDVAMGKIEAGLEWAKKLWEYAQKAGLLPPKWWILRPLAGDTYRFSIVGEFASMAESEEYFAKAQADSGWMTIVKEMRESDWCVGFERTYSQVVEEG